MNAEPDRTAAERRLAAVLTEVADSRSPTPDFDDVRRRAAAHPGPRGVMPAGPARARWTLAAAAVVLVVAGIIVAATGDGSSPVETVPPADAPAPTDGAPESGATDLPPDDDLAAELGLDGDQAELLRLWDPLEDLTFALEPDGAEVRAGDGLAVEVIVTNPTAEPVTVPECFEDAVNAAIVEPGADPPPMAVTCTRGPGTEVAPGATAAFPVDGLVARTRATWFDGHLGALPTGTYEAVVGLPGPPTGRGAPTLRVPVTVTEARCPGLTDELVAGYIRLSEDDAFARAEDQGRSVRLVERDGVALSVTLDLRCDRINLSLVDDRVVGVGLG